MIIKAAVYNGSYITVGDCPKGNLPEFAFIGRSNVGKSSLINMLSGKKDLVKVSNSPGKTRMINFFLINNQFHFVDLPGYGYAQVSQLQRKSFEKMIFGYLTERKPLHVVFVLIDSRHTPQLIDLQFVNRLGEWQVPFMLVFTKADKQKVSVTRNHVTLFHDEMLKTWEEIPSSFITSAESKAGREQLLKSIAQMLDANRTGVH